MFFSAGFGFLIYIILWVLLPEATTTAEKLEMEGEHVTIDNIEKKIREEFSAIKETLEDGANNVKKKVADGFQKNGKKATSGLQELIGVIGTIFSVLFSCHSLHFRIPLYHLLTHQILTFNISFLRHVVYVHFKLFFLQVPNYLQFSSE